ncbi:MAG: M48 family metalloprotease [Pedobacter sp.]|nr:M48 family metalloprotease [Pedobacter sp.]
MKRLFPFFLLLLSTTTFPSHAGQGSSDLPELGDDVSSVISPEQEYRLGRTWLRQLRGSTPAVSDPVVQDYLEHLCYRLAFHSPLQNPDLSLIVIPDKSINAFAVPGGVVGINVGLLLNAETEAETAGVLGHELGHLSQRHFARQLASQKQNQWMYLGTLLASIALAAAGSGDGAYALGMGAQAAMVDNQLSYSRQYEQEADRIGMQTLVDSGMDPHAMPVFFQRLQRQSRMVGNIPEFVLTHPLTESRIADTMARANQYTQKLPQDSLDYQLVRVRLAAIYLADSGRGIAFFQQQLRELSPNSDRARANRLGLTIALARDRQYDKAREALAPLLQENPLRVDYLAAAADIELADRQYDAAIKLLTPAVTLNPDSYPLLVYYARAQIAANHPEQVIERLEAAARERSDDPQIWRLLVDAYTASKNTLGIYRSRAEVYFLNGDDNRALEQLRMAASGVRDNYPLTAKIQKRMREMQQAKGDLKG